MRRFWLCLALLNAALHIAPAHISHAQVASEGLTKLLLPFEGGSGRPVAESLADGARMRLGRTVAIENKPGASGRIAAMALKRAAPDGMTLAQFPIAVPVLVPLSSREVHYTAHDFAPVTQIATYDLAFAVSGSHPAKSVAEFVAWLKSHPSGRFYGSPGAGTLPHFLGVMFAREIGIGLTHVPYKGPGAMKMELIEGSLASGFSVVSDLIELHRAGRIRILSTSGTKRLAQLPDVPTFAEQGYPSVVAAGWVGVFAPAGTPGVVIHQWSSALAATVRSPGTQRQLLELGVEPTGTTPEEFAAIIDADLARWAPIVKMSGFQAD